jgi:hypothetical protein
LDEILDEADEVEENLVFDDFLNADQALDSTGTRTSEDIAESVQEQPVELEIEDELVEAEVQSQPPFLAKMPTKV